MDVMKPGDNGGENEGDGSTGDEPTGSERGVLGVGLKEPTAETGKTESKKQPGFNANKDMMAKKDRIAYLNKRRKQKMGVDTQYDGPKDEVNVIEEETRGELEEIVLEGKTGLSKFLTQLGLRLRLITPESNLKKEEKNLEGQIRVYVRENGRVKKQIAKVRKKTDGTRADLEDCYENDTLIKEMLDHERTRLGELGQEVKEGLKKKEDVTKKRADARAKEAYVQSLKEDQLENALQIREYESALEKMKDQVGYLTTKQKGKLQQIYALKKRLPGMKAAADSAKQETDDATRDKTVKDTADRMVRLSGMLNEKRHRIEVVALENRVDMDYDGEQPSQEREETRAKRDDAIAEFDKSLQEITDGVEVSKRRYYESL